LGLTIGCSQNKANTPDVKDQVSRSLDNAGFKNISVDVNKDKQLVTLKGNVKSQEEKDQVEQLAKGASSGFVISNEVGVRPEGVEGEARKIDSNVDSAIEKDFKAVIIANRLENQHIRYNAKNGVLTLKGKVENMGVREKAEKLAASVPNVQQVVNELDVKGGKRAHTAE
jgi:osmotically-inducible protein OsmY